MVGYRQNDQISDDHISDVRVAAEEALRKRLGGYHQNLDNMLAFYK